MVPHSEAYCPLRDTRVSHSGSYARWKGRLGVLLTMGVYAEVLVFCRSRS